MSMSWIWSNSSTTPLSLSSSLVNGGGGEEGGKDEGCGVGVSTGGWGEEFLLRLDVEGWTCLGCSAASVDILDGETRRGATTLLADPMMTRVVSDMSSNCHASLIEKRM
ncbi:hypothetical protein PGTUg99_009539 [Puccinia graminis f. sp. tritici]|uniref:Uncharacterized protein n=1 Tax=Puccinia graminis f. sp. tritici TaxID=56615 RepID=A0A5B0M1R6_PUCGR|nr:hypothetical protein PGTUg99_009539 [Puccinia graminis f. sp. tritici]